jgi:hypothetical protein
MLKPDQVEIIRKHYERGLNPTVICRCVPFNVSRQAIIRMIRTENWERKPVVADAQEETLAR